MTIGTAIVASTKVRRIVGAVGAKRDRPHRRAGGRSTAAQGRSVRNAHYGRSAILATGVTFHLTYRIIADEGATNAATVGYLLPVVSVALGAILLGEQVGVRVLIGMAIVLAGV